MNKTGPGCKYFYTVMDCGLDSKEPRDSLAKMPGRRGMHGSDPLDNDPAAQIKNVRDLIWCAKLRSGGPGPKGARGGGTACRSSAPWRRSTGVGGLVATVGIWACGLVQKKVHDTSKPLEDTGWPFGARLWLAVVRGGPWVTGEPRSRGTGPDLAWVLVLEQQRGTAKLPGGSDRDGIERSRAPAMARRRG